MTLNDKAVEIAGKMNKPRPFELGDPVIHKSTGLCGTVEAIERIVNTDGQMLTVALLNGKHIRGLRREEIGLHHPSGAQVRAQLPHGESVTVQPEQVAVKIEGPISDASILDELC